MTIKMHNKRQMVKNLTILCAHNISWTAIFSALEISLTEDNLRQAKEIPLNYRLSLHPAIFAAINAI